MVCIFPKILDPTILFCENINGETYRDMLVNHLRPHLCRKRKLSSTIYQQDGATANTSKETIALCQKIFRDRLISLKSNFPWPANNPDLSPQDYYLWSKIRQNVYNQKLTNTHELKPYI